MTTDDTSYQMLWDCRHCGSEGLLGLDHKHCPGCGGAQDTGSRYFPGGLGEFLCPQNEFLVFENGPSMDATLQWASYQDASDQCSLSRIWGGIHPGADDLPGRLMGLEIGPDSFNKALEYFSARFCDEDVNMSGAIDFGDVLAILAAWGKSGGREDVNGDGLVGFVDIVIVLAAWGPCE